MPRRPCASSKMRQSFKFSCRLLRARKSRPITSVSVLTEGKQDGERRILLPGARFFAGPIQRDMKLRSMLGTVSLSALLLGCGGGGGGEMQPPGPLPPNPPPTPTADSFRTAEYNNVGTLDQVHAAQAYALGYTGAGVIVGVVDFNFQLGSSEINFHPDSVGANPQA